VITGRRRTLLLALLAVAVPLPALAASEGSLTASPASLSVSTSLGSCGLAGSEIACALDVSYNSLPGATSYSATVTRADGSVIDYGEVGAGGTTLWVPYVGSGTYSVRITAYGEPEQPEGERPVISTETSGARADRGDEPRKPEGGEDASVEAEAAPGGGLPETDVESEGAVEAEPECVPGSPEPEPVEPAPVEPAPAPLPEPPPADLDPEDPDEDGDGIADEQERLDYEAAVAALEAAEAAAAPDSDPAEPAPSDCP
jgi:hypothetical protein